MSALTGTGIAVAGTSSADTIDLSAQTNEISILDNSAAALNITEGSNSYLKFISN